MADPESKLPPAKFSALVVAGLVIQLVLLGSTAYLVPPEGGDILGNGRRFCLPHHRPDAGPRPPARLVQAMEGERP